jgi:hypothetical protein
MRFLATTLSGLLALLPGHDVSDDCGCDGVAAIPKTRATTDEHDHDATQTGRATMRR